MNPNEQLIEANKKQWLEYFASGQRYDIPFNKRYVLTAGKLLGLLALRGTVATMENNAVLQGANAVGAFNQISEYDYGQKFFGDTPTPTAGVSGWGLHFPTIPGIAWEDISGIIIMNELSIMSQARNGFMLETPPVGSAPKMIRWDYTYITVMIFILADGTKVQASMPNPENRDLIHTQWTPQGKNLGRLQMFLDPFLGPEQGVEYLFLVHLMADLHNIQILHSDDFVKAHDLFQQIVSMN